MVPRGCTNKNIKDHFHTALKERPGFSFVALIWQSSTSQAFFVFVFECQKISAFAPVWSSPTQKVDHLTSSTEELSVPDSLAGLRHSHHPSRRRLSAYWEEIPHLSQPRSSASSLAWPPVHLHTHTPHSNSAAAYRSDFQNLQVQNMNCPGSSFTV